MGVLYFFEGVVSSSFFLSRNKFPVLCYDNLQLQTITVCVCFNVLVQSWIFLITGHKILYNWIMIICN